MEDGMRYTDPNDPEITVTKYAMMINVSEDMLIDAGLSDGPSHFPEFHPSWISKIRWNLSQKVARLRLRLGSWIAGVDLDSYEP